MTASETPEAKPSLPGFVDLLKSSFAFLATPPHAAVLYGFAGWLIIPVLISLGSSFLDPSFGDPLEIIAAILFLGLSLWASAAMTIMISGIVRPDLVPNDAVTSVSELAWRRAPKLFWVSLLTILLQVFGFIFIIPGIVFTVWFAFAETEAVLTGAGVFSSLTQSRQRVRGHFFAVLWRIFAFSFLLSLILTLILSPILSAAGITDVSTLFPNMPAWLNAILSFISILLMPLILTYELHLYFSLRGKTG